MALPTITIPLDPQTAQMYNSAWQKRNARCKLFSACGFASLSAANNVPCSRFLMRPDARRRLGG